MRKYYCDRCEREIGTDVREVYVYEVIGGRYEICEECNKEISKPIMEKMIKNFNEWIRE